MQSSDQASQTQAGIGPFGLDTGELLLGIRRKKWLILATALAAGAAVAAGTMRQPKVYEAVARILIEPAVPKILAESTSFDGLSEQAQAEHEFLNTQYKIITSRGIVRDVIAQLALGSDRDFLASYGLEKLSGDDLDKAVEETVLSLLTIVPEPGTRIVKIVVQDHDAARAARIANTIASTYIDQSLEHRTASSQQASKWLDARAVEFAKKLDAAERALYDFKRANSLVSVSLEDRQNMVANSLAKLSGDLVETRAKLIDAEAERAVVREELSRPDGTVEAMPKLVEHSLLQDLKATLNALEKQRVEYEARYGPRHPNMIALEKQITEVKEHLAQERALIVRKIDNEIETLEKTETGLVAAIESAKKQALELNNLGLDYSKLTRDFGTTKTMYESLLKRQTEADLSGMLKSNFVRSLETAEIQPVPIKPSMPKNVAIGLAAGLCLGLLLVAGGVLLDNTVHSQSDIEGYLSLPFLGVLPSIEVKQEEKAGIVKHAPERDLYIARNPKSQVAECARSIRTNLMFLGTDKPLRRVLITSAGPAEGKSTSAIALALTMAQAGNRVLLIDTDLRRPRLHRTFGVSGELGLTSLLLEVAKPEDALKSTEIVGLDLLPCGPLPPNPAELLHGERFVRVLEQLGERYDRILLDSPPVNAVTDAVILSRIVDGTIIIVKAAKTAKDAARRAARLLNDVNAKLLGAVLNDVGPDTGGYGYNYYYRRYGYTYGSDEEQAKA